MKHNNDLPVLWTERMEVRGGPRLNVPIRVDSLSQVAMGRTRAIVEGPCYVGGGCGWTQLRATIEHVMGGE